MNPTSSSTTPAATRSPATDHRGDRPLTRRACVTAAGAAAAMLLGGCIVVPARYADAPEPGPEVAVAPPPPAYEVIPASPGPAYVWIGGYWSWQLGRHVWIGGRWGLPPARGSVWVPGAWQPHGRAWRWHGGYWRGRGRR